MQKQNPQWLDLFITAFGAKGLVALAWWLGSLHAERIRAARGSFPILHITGGAGAGASSLTGVLWWLLGESDGQVIYAASTTRMAMHHMLFNPIDWPVVLEDTWTRNEQTDFDWEAIKSCYSGTTMARLTSRDAVLRETRFQGALVIVGGINSDALHQRTVQIALDRATHTEQTRNAILALSQLPLNELATFKTAAKRHRAKLLNRLQQSTPAYIEALLDDTNHSLMQLDTHNHAQLRALIDALQDLYPITPEQAQAAHAQVHDMAWRCCAPY